MFLIETIYPTDADSGALDYKLVRFVRAFRAEAITAPRSEARLQGYFATNPDMDAGRANAERADLRRRMTAIEDRIVAQGIARAQVIRLGVSQAALSGGQIVLTNGSALDISQPLFTPAVPLPPILLAEGATDPGPPGTRPTWTDGIETEGSLTYDPKDKHIKTEVSISYKSNGLPMLESVNATFALGPDGKLKEVSSDFTPLKVKIMDRWARDTVTDVQFAFKATPAFDIAKSELEAKFKAVLSADVRVPATPMRIGIDVSAYVDNKGKSEVALGFTLFKF